MHAALIIKAIQNAGSHNKRGPPMVNPSFQRAAKKVIAMKMVKKHYQQKKELFARLNQDLLDEILKAEGTLNFDRLRSSEDESVAKEELEVFIETLNQNDKVKEVSFRDNFLSDEDIQVFSLLKHIDKIDLRDNMLTYQGVSFLLHNTDIKVLDVRNNRMHRLPNIPPGKTLLYDEDQIIEHFYDNDDSHANEITQNTSSDTKTDEKTENMSSRNQKLCSIF